MPAQFKFPSLLFLAFTGMIVLPACKSKSKIAVPDQSGDSGMQKETTISENSFNEILKQDDLPAVYYWDSTLMVKQMTYPGTISATDAFAKGVQAMFEHSANIKGKDDFYSMIMADPASYNLTKEAGAEDIKKAIVALMKQDKKLKFFLLPEDTETYSPDGVKLFPPEDGETVKDFWIWYIKCDFFPGPAWMIVKRDGTIPAYHYGYL